MSKPVITEEYRRLQRQLHENPAYGTASLQYAPIVRQLAERLGAASICDYGAGKQNLRLALEKAGFRPDYRPYDPAFPEYGEARSADLVCCIDVLEHIEPELLDNVLDDLARLTVKHGLFSVHVGPAQKVLADGRNAHLIQQPLDWWLPRLQAKFTLAYHQPAPGGFLVVVTPKA